MINATNTRNTLIINRFMRITFMISFVLLITSQMLFAINVNGQSISNDKVTLKLEEESLLKGIEKIEEQTIFRFYYRKTDIKHLTDLNLAMNTRTVEETLSEILRNTDLTFRQLNNNILLEKIPKIAEYQIKGRVLGSDRKPLELVTINLSKVSSPNIKFTVLADTGGRFMFKISEKGEYLLKTYAFGADSLTQTINVENNSLIELPDILLKATSIQLKSVNITEKRSLISRSIDKLMVNVEGSEYEKGQNALKLFNIIPGVNLNGKSLVFRGSEGVTVYVDNRRIMLSGDQLLSYLQAIPSESIKAYELKVVPGAEVDAQNSGVVINIVLKTEYKFGLSGNVSTGYWYNSMANTKGTTFLNYRTGKFNLQGGFNYLWSPSFYEDEINQQFKSETVLARQLERYVERYHNISYFGSIDYKVDANQTIGASYNVMENPGSFSGKYNTDIDFISNAQATSIDSSLFSTRNSKFSYSNHMGNLFYRNKLDTLGSRIDVAYSYINYRLVDPSALETQFLDGGGVEMRMRDSLFNKTIGKSKIHVANIDFENHFSNSFVLNAGSKYTASKTDYSIDFRNGLNENATLDPVRSNRFLYSENIIAFYSSLSGSFKKWNFKVGLRTEHTNYDGKSVTTGQNIGRDQWNLFPSLFLNRKVGGDHSFTFSYARRIERPGFRQLNPFVTYTNLYTIQEGNPNLVPFFSNNFQVEYLLKSKYSFTIGYQNTENGIINNVTSIGDVVVSRDENLSDKSNVFGSIYVPVKITKWWQLSANTTFRYRTMDIKGTTPLNRSKFSNYLSVTNKVDLPGKYFLEISGFHKSNDFLEFYDQFSYGKLDITIRKDFFNDKLSTSLEFYDPFHLYKPRYEINTTQFTRTVLRNKLDYVRYVGIFLTYNFSSGKKRNNIESVGAAGNEARGRL